MKDSRTTRMSNPSMVRTVFWNALTRGMLTCPVSELGVRDDQQLPVEYDRYQRRLPGATIGQWCVGMVFVVPQRDPWETARPQSAAPGCSDRAPYRCGLLRVREWMPGIGEGSSQSSDSAPPAPAMSRVARRPIRVPSRPPTIAPKGRMP